MTYVSDDVKAAASIVPEKSGILSRMTRPGFRRLAGLRFTYLIQQLQEQDPNKWTMQAIADAIRCDRSLVSKWSPENVRQRREPADRSGITDLVIQGIHDGLGVSSEFLFVADTGLPKHIRLPDGTQRPTEPDEVDHRLFPVSLDEHRQKVQLRDYGTQLKEHSSELEAVKGDLAEIRLLLRQLLGTSKPAGR